MNRSRYHLKTLEVLMLLLMAMILSPGSVSALDYYLDPANGNDSNNGTKISPWKTMNKVIVSLSPGDTLYIKGGTYTEDQYYDKNSEAYTSGILSWTQTDSLGTANNPITIKAALGEKVVFDGKGSGYFLYFNPNNQVYPGHYVILKDLEFRNYKGVGLRMNNGVRNVAIENCSFLNFGDADTGAVESGNSENIIVKNSHFENIGVASSKMHSIYVSKGNKYVLLDNNVIKGSSGFTIHGYGNNDFTKPVKNWIVRRNTIINAHSNHLIATGTNYTNLYIYNNTFYSTIAPYPSFDTSNTDAQITFKLSSGKTLTNLYIKNNLGYAPLDVASLEMPYPANVSGNFYLNYNLWYNITNPNKIYLWSTTYYNTADFRAATGHEQNSIVGDPLFINPAADNFNLQVDSKAIDNGTFLTTTVGSGSGTTITVADAGFFNDGFGMIQGDTIKVGSNDPVIITTINYDNNTITVDKAISWNNGENVSLPYSGARPDIGAYEYAGGGGTDTTPPLPPTGFQVTD